MKLLRLIFINLLFFTRLVGQTDLTEADEFFNAGHYSQAINTYLEELKKQPDQTILNYKAGVCYLNSRSQKDKALPYLQKCVKQSDFKNPDKNIAAPLIAIRFLGDAYVITHQFDKAIETFEKYKSHLNQNNPEDALQIEEANARIEVCEFAKELKEPIAIPALFKPTSLAGSKETTIGEYSFYIAPDKSTIVHTLKVPLNDQGPEKGNKYFEPVKLPKTDSTNTKTVSKKINNVSPSGSDTIIYAATVGTSIDGQIIITYRNDNGEGNLYVSRLMNNKWTIPEKLKKPVNLKGWETNECLTPDGKTMYFVSNRPGGYGGSDIYRCTKLQNGEWSKAVNVGPPVNTKSDEEAPFVNAEGNVLYFSSDRIKPGSYDIFSSTLSGREWNKPVNVGFPINRNEHDIYQVAADKRKIYARSTDTQKNKTKQADTLKETVSQNNDNFLVSILNPSNPPVILLIGEVLDNAGKPVPGLTITVSDNVKDETLGKYIASNKTGHFSITLDPGKNHNIRYEAPGYLFQSENIAVNKENKYFDRHHEVKMEPIEKDAHSKLNNVFFEEGKASLASESKPELDHLYRFMVTNPGIELAITNTIYSKSDRKTNRKLSEARAGEVKKYLISKGIAKNRLSAYGERKSEKKEKKENGHHKKDKKNKIDKEPQVTQELEIRIKQMNS